MQIGISDHSPCLINPSSGVRFRRINHKIRVWWLIWRSLWLVYNHSTITYSTNNWRENIYKTIIWPATISGSECCTIKKKNVKECVAEGYMLSWRGGDTLEDRKRGVCIYKMWRGIFNWVIWLGRIFLDNLDMHIGDWWVRVPLAIKWQLMEQQAVRQTKMANMEKRMW